MNNARQDGWIKGSERRKKDMRKKDRKTEEEEDRGGRWRASSTTRSSPPGAFTLGGKHSTAPLFLFYFSDADSQDVPTVLPHTRTHTHTFLAYKVLIHPNCVHIHPHSS